MHRLTILHATDGRKLSKRYTVDGSTPYPLVRAFNSTEAQIDGDDWYLPLVEQLYEVALTGGAILKGHFDRNLHNESRKGHTEKDAANSLLVLDVDGLDLETLSYRKPTPPRVLTREEMEVIVEEVVHRLPQCFHDSSYVAHASASMGRKNTVHLHLFFMLTKPLMPREQKDVLRSLNLVCTSFRSQCTLTASKIALSYIIDPSLADNSRIIYIAPPEFIDQHDPVDPEARLFHVIKDHPHINTTMLRRDTVRAAPPTEGLRTLKAQLRAREGLPNVDHPTSTHIDLLGNSNEVICNPDATTMTLVSDEGDYVRYNVGGGDSGAYWVHKVDPRIVHNFKGEPAFLFEIADREEFHRCCKRVGFRLDTIEHETLIPFCFYDPAAEMYYSARRYASQDRLVECYPTRRNNLDTVMQAFGSDVPEQIPLASYTFAPDDPRAVDLESRFVNRFAPPPLMQSTPDIEDGHRGATIDNAVRMLPSLCPTIFKVMYSMAGCGDRELALFLNWLAFIYQQRNKAQTLWLFHGVEGTGKGLFHAHVITPIFQQYTCMMTDNALGDRYDTRLSENLIVVMDEVHFSSATDIKEFNLLKNLVTEPTLTVRPLFGRAKSERNFCSLILFSNDLGALKINRGDRRCHIAPRQEEPLFIRYPELQKNVIPMLRKEAPLLAAFLRHFEVREDAVFRPELNEAKEQARLATQLPMEAFSEALKFGQIDWFLTALEDAPHLSADGDTGVQMRMAHGMGLLRQVLANIPESLETPGIYTGMDIWTLYSVMNGGDSRGYGKNTFLQMLKRTGSRGLIPVRKRPADWQGKPPHPVQAYSIQWRSELSMDELKELQQRHIAQRHQQT